MTSIDITAFGMCSWDRMLVVDSYPGPGEYAIVRNESQHPGGTTANTCAALARLGLRPQIVGAVGPDEEGDKLVESLRDEGCDVQHLRRKNVPTDRGVIIVSGSGPNADRTIYWLQGARIAYGDRLPMHEMLERRWMLIDVDDARLRSFLLDFPAHQSPRTRLIGAMTYLVEMEPEDGLQQGLQHDVLIGNERELIYLTGTPDLEAATRALQSQMPATACRGVYVSRGASGAIAITAGSVAAIPAFPVEVADTTGAGDAFAAGCIFGIINGWSEERILQLGNAVGGLACRELGARSSLPFLADAQSLIQKVAD